MNLALLIPNSTPFIALADYAVNRFKKDFASIIVIAHDTATPFEDFTNRVKKTGILNAFDEFLYCKFESLFGHWDSAVIQNQLKITANNEIIFIRSLKSNELATVLEENRSDILVGIGCGYVMIDHIPQRVLPLNIHPGILPIYKGLGNPEAMIRNDHNNMGLTIHRMSKQIDSGEIFLIRRISLLKRLTIPESYILCYKTGIRLLACALANRLHEISKNHSATLNNHLWRMSLSRFIGNRILYYLKYLSNITYKTKTKCFLINQQSASIVFD